MFSSKRNTKRIKMSLDTATKTALFNALAWIESKKSDAGIEQENVELGLQCLTEAFGVNLQDAAQRSAYKVSGNASFEEIFAAGLNALGLSAGVDDSVENDPAVTKNPALWKKWVGKLEDKGYFKGKTVGSEEYNALLKKALLKYKERVADAKPATPVLSKEEKEKLAEDAKAKGNTALTGGNYEEAAKLYTEAISLSPDGPNSHIYYANYAAALMHLERYSEVIDNCEKAIELKPSYVRAYSRLGNAYVHLKDFDGAIDAYRRGLEVDATNAACRDGLADAERKRQQLQAPAASRSAGPAGGAGGMPDLSGLASMFGGGGGGGGGLADLLSNPAMQQMAASMMQNPAMMQMAQNMMQNPDALNNLMGGLGGGGGGGGGMPNMAGMADAFRNSPELMAARSDPDLQDFFRDVDQEGPSAAMRHMSNPKVSQLIQNAMGRMQG